MTWDPWKDCTEACAEVVPCPICGRDLPPRGRSVGQEVYLPNCCEEHHYDSANTRHLWSVDELAAVQGDTQ